MMYLWLKAFHIIFVISWMCGLLYLPRLFVYHVDSDQTIAHTFMTMEKRLFLYIMTPAMILTLVTGSCLIFCNKEILMHGYMHMKLLLIIFMMIFHATCFTWMKRLRYNSNLHTKKFYKIVNEIPTILMVIIVILITVKPF